MGSVLPQYSNKRKVVIIIIWGVVKIILILQIPSKRFLTR